MITLQLVRIITLNISTMILEEVGEFVVEKNSGVEVERNIELDDALRGSRGVVGVRGVLDERVLWRRELGVGLRRTETVAEMGHIGQLILGVRERRGSG